MSLRHKIRGLIKTQQKKATKAQPGENSHFLARKPLERRAEHKNRILRHSVARTTAPASPRTTAGTAAGSAIAATEGWEGSDKATVATWKAATVAHTKAAVAFAAEQFDCCCCCC